MESYPGTNGSVSGVGVGVFPTEHHHHHLPLSVPVFTATACSSPYLDDSNSNNSLSEIFLDQYTEVDVSSEWLSSFVEECLSSAGNCLPPLPKLEQPKTATPSTTTTRTITPPKCAAAAANDNSTCLNPQISDKITITPNKIQTHQHFAVPGKPRSQRKRRRPTTTTTTTDKNPLLRWAECLYPETQPHQQLGFSDHPPLLEQAYWLADSELISLPRNDVKTLEDGDYENSNKLNNKKKKMKKEDKRLEELDDEEFGNENSEGTGWEQQQQMQQQTRRCSHCQAQKTPQWRAGPLGPKTLCNACGVRYFKSGRLLPEYRPAKSPTFVSDKHSNSHKKVLQMRKAHLAPPLLP